MSSQISVIMSATQGPAGPAGAAGSAGPAGAQGEAGPAGPAGAFTDAGITSGTSMAYTAVLADRPEPLTAGYSFLIVPHVTNGVSPTISLSGGTAQPIWVKGAPIPAGAMVANNPYALRSDGTRCHVEGQLNLSADEIVAKFTGTPDGTKFLRDDGTLAAGGSGSGIQHATTAGTTTAYTLTPATAVTLVEGVKIAFKLDQSCGASPTLNVSGTGAKNMTTPGMVNFAALQLLAEGEYEATYNAANDKWVVTSNFALKAADTPEVLPLAGGTVSGTVNIAGDLHFTTTDRMITAGGNTNGAGQFDIKCGHLRFISGGSEYQRFSTNGITFSRTADPPDYGVGRSATPALTLRGPSAGGIECLAGSTSVQAKIGTTGITFPNGQTNPGSAYGICRDTGENATVVVSASSAASYLSASGGAFVMAHGASHATYSGMTYLNPKAVSLANSAQRTIAISATGRSGFVEIVDLTNHRVARYSINAGVPTKDSGHAQFVAGAPGAGEVGVELSSTTLRVNNNSGGALLIAINAMLAY